MRQPVIPVDPILPTRIPAINSVHASFDGSILSNTGKSEFQYSILDDSRGMERNYSAENPLLSQSLRTPSKGFNASGTLNSTRPSSHDISSEIDDKAERAQRAK
jgi:hypothetical protein